MTWNRRNGLLVENIAAVNGVPIAGVAAINGIAKAGGGGGGGVPVMVQSSKSSGYSGTGATITFPLGVGNASRVIIALLVNPDMAITPPSGFALDATLSHPDYYQQLRYYSRAGFTGSPSSFTFTWGTDTLWSAVAVEASNVGAFSGSHGLSGSWGNAGAGHSINVTAPAANAFAVVFMALSDSVLITGTLPAIAVAGAADYSGGVSSVCPTAGSNTVAWTYSSNSQAFFGAAVYSPQ
jgi:hypothetical protein